MLKCSRIIMIMLIMLLICSGCGDKEKSAHDSEETTMDQQEINSAQNELEDIPETENMGEGAPEPIDFDMETSDAYQIKDTIRIGTEQDVLYELVIDEIAYTDMRDEYVQDQGNVILVTYTYKNLSDEAIMIDDMSFGMMLSDESTSLDPYYLADILVPEPIEKGDSCTAQIAYAAADQPESLVLIYHDIVNTEISPVKVKVDNLQQQNVK